MCTLVLAHRATSDLPLVVLANRDEFLDRPTSPPGELRSMPNAFGGRDVRAGGTWCGLNERGLFVGITNLVGGMVEASRPSRGLLCLELLGLPTGARVAQFLRSIPVGRYNGFRILASDGTTGCEARYLETCEVRDLEPGVHAVTNWPEGDPGDAKRDRIRAGVAAAVRGTGSQRDVLRALAVLAAEHTGDRNPRESICCHAGPYGTRSSSLVVRGREGVSYWHADGPPCTAQFVDHSDEVGRMLRGSATTPPRNLHKPAV